MLPVQHTETLANGLRVQLHHHPHLKQAAAWLRVSAGSHDVPSAWPGLAHLLEHLFFLGTERFSGDQALMPYVQRHGGQLNASTRERCTDFFFELPPTCFADGLERLCEMLGHPRLGTAEQLREREVLHAEFIAWARDPQARHEQWLTSPLNPAHPLRAFHAGNRYSLPVPRQAFQQGLQDFYRDYYQTGQMTLCLVGPQPLSELRDLAQQASHLLAEGPGTVQALPPALLADSTRAPPRPNAARLDLLFACERLPGADLPAVTFLATRMVSVCCCYKFFGYIASASASDRCRSLLCGEGARLFSKPMIRDVVDVCQLPLSLRKKWREPDILPRQETEQMG